MTPKLFSELGLSAELLKAIDKLGFEQAAPIQAEAIPVLMAGKDVVGQSQTGSGKTAAFGIPAVEKVDVAKRAVQVLVLCPTRELAIQVSEEIHKLAFFKRGIHALPIYGGQSYERQFLGLKQGAQIVIGTPGRVMDHMRRGTLRLDSIKMVILDEADVMLNMGFRDDIETILKDAPKERQTVFFSATMPRPIRDLIERYSREPQNIKMEQKAMTVPTVEQVYYEVDRRYKIDLLTRLIDIHDYKLGIVFCNTKRMVDDLVDHLNAQGYSADRLHGDMSQMQRDRVMQKFRKSGLEFLVATDVAARGIDVEDVEVVFNYDLPYDGEDYVHRIGRTGRKGKEGRAVSFAAGREVFQIRNIERYTNMRIQRGKVPTVTEVEEVRANVFLDKLRVTLKGGEFKRHDHLIERLLEEGFASTDICSALINHLQGGDAAPAKPAPREERPARHDDRPSYRDERPPYREARGDRRSTPPERVIRQAERPLMPVSATRPAAAAMPRVKKVVTPPPARPPSAPAKHVTPPAAVVIAATEPRAKPVVKAPPVESMPLAMVEGGARHSVRAEVSPDTDGAHPAMAGRSITTKSDPASKTFSDAEILAAVKPKVVKPVEAKPAPKEKISRATPEHQTRLWMSIGEEMGVVPIDIVNSIAGETGLPGKVVGKVDVRERHLFVDVNSENANAIIAKLNRSQIKGHKLKVKVA